MLQQARWRDTNQLQYNPSLHTEKFEPQNRWKSAVQPAVQSIGICKSTEKNSVFWQKKVQMNQRKKNLLNWRNKSATNQLEKK